MEREDYVNSSTFTSSSLTQLTQPVVNRSPLETAHEAPDALQQPPDVTLHHACLCAAPGTAALLLT